MRLDMLQTVLKLFKLLLEKNELMFSTRKKDEQQQQKTPNCSELLDTVAYSLIT